MQHSAMIEILKSLKLHGMAHAIDELAAQGAPAYQAAQTILDSLLKAEVAEREVRSVNYQIKLARFPAYRDLSGFDFSQSVVNEALIRLLHRGQFMDEAHNVVLIGGPGTGKTTTIARVLVLLAALDGQRRHDHHDRGTDAEDQGLAEVQPAERGPDARCRNFVARHGLVETARFHVLVAEILHGFEVQE